MIISHKFRYLFIEVPHTASTAISAELREHYAGERICHKHANYREFYPQASPDEKKYLVFGAVRNPLDALVTEFCKFREDHKGSFSNPSNYARNGGWVEDGHVDKFQFVQKTNGDFPKFFQRYHRKIYFNWFLLGHRRFKKIMRFENIQNDFEETLKLLNIKPFRSLPIVNKSARPDSFEDFFSEELQLDVVKYYGPFLHYWGYSFPDSFGLSKIPKITKIQYQLIDRIANSMSRVICLSPKNKNRIWNMIRGK